MGPVFTRTANRQHSAQPNQFWASASDCFYARTLTLTTETSESQGTPVPVPPLAMPVTLTVPGNYNKKVNY